jgi:hypothetical protein
MSRAQISILTLQKNSRSSNEHRHNLHSYSNLSKVTAYVAHGVVCACAMERESRAVPMN